MFVSPLLTMYMQFRDRPPQVRQETDGTIGDALHDHMETGDGPLQAHRLRHHRPCREELCQLIAVGLSCVS